MASAKEMGCGLRLLLLLVLGLGVRAWGTTYYVTVAGLGGEADYEQRFTAQANDLDKIFKVSGGRVFTMSGAQATAATVRTVMLKIASEARAEDDLVLILIGHGSFDGSEYKFNLVGPDLTAGELGGMCDRVAAHRQLVVDTTSASGGAMAALVHPGRMVIAATKSGTEKNATVFARYWVEALQDPAADTDKSDSVSALEAFSYAQKKTASFYEAQKRLATEHAVTAGAGLGSFTLVRMGAEQKAANDPAKQRLLGRKEELEQKIDELKYVKAAMDAGDYKKQMTAALLELAKVQEALDQ